MIVAIIHSSVSSAELVVTNPRLWVCATYQQLLRTWRTPELHSLPSFLMRAPDADRPGKVTVQMNLSARDTALYLLAGPL
jgi:hypothetical protein